MTEKNTDPLWGEETAKALENFGRASGGSSLSPIPRCLIRAYAEVKLAALEAIEETEGYFGHNTMDALRTASLEMIRGVHDDAFPLPLAQGGAGTSFHMNLNEVLASLTARSGDTRLDPIEDLARHQSTNDTFASAAVLVAFRLAEDAEEGTVALQEDLVKKESAYDDLLMIGRTEMQDALPMRAGSLFGAWAGGIERDRWRLSKVTERVREVPLGGTALGTGFGAPRSYVHAAERHLRRITGLPVARSQNMMDGVGLKDTLAEVAGALRLASMNIAKMASDMLFYTSSPVGEFIHPSLQYGSSMMPLKSNPVLLERCRGLALSAMGEADKVHLFAGEGDLQLNAYLPFLLRSLIACAQESRTARDDFQRFLAGVEPDKMRMERNLSRSPALLNALMPLVGYRNLKSLESALAAEAPETLAELAELTAKETGIDLPVVLEALKPSRLAGPPKEN